jgi:uncharacterized protein
MTQDTAGFGSRETMRKSSSRIVAGAGLCGNVDAVRQLAGEACKVGSGAVALLGTLRGRETGSREYVELFKAVSGTGLPTFYVPGAEDAPFSEFLREAAALEVVYPSVRGIHGTFAMSSGHFIWSGMGGVVEDDPDRIREEDTTLCYPGWEVEYRLKFLHELKDYQKVFLFTTPPEHKGLGQKGSFVLAETIKTYNPRLVLAGGERRQVTIGKRRDPSASRKSAKNRFLLFSRKWY